MGKVILIIKNFFKFILIDFWTDRRVAKGQLDNQVVIAGDVVKKTSEDRKRSLEAFIISRVSQGWRIEGQTEYAVVLAHGKKPNHILHFFVMFSNFWIVAYRLDIHGYEHDH